MELQTSKQKLSSEQIKEELSKGRVTLFMKGSPAFPQCGFSARAIQILKAAGLRDDQLHHVDVLEQASFREAMKDYSSWPTFPQVYLEGEFLGGADLLLDLYEKGELQKMLLQS